MTSKKKKFILKRSQDRFLLKENRKKENERFFGLHPTLKIRLIMNFLGRFALVQWGLNDNLLQ